MGEALFQLEQVLMSKREKLTPQEASILASCKSKALMDFTDGAVVAGAVAWTATWKLKRLFRVNLAAGAAVFFGLRSLSRTLDSCADYILQMEGSIMQKELANILVKQSQNDPWKMQFISRHFYMEKVYDESTADHPKLRWRYRNSFVDNLDNGQRIHAHDFSDSSLGDSHDDSNTQGGPKEASNSAKTNRDTKHIFKNPVLDMKEETDPLDSLFTYSGPVEEIHHTGTPNKPPGIHHRGHKRSHRRRRMRHHENCSNSEV